jgi:hypothetical protein
MTWLHKSLACSWLVTLFLCCLLTAQVPSMPPEELVRKTVNNEVKPADNHNYIFQSRKESSKGSQTRLYVQTKEAMAGLLVANDDKPLTPEQRKNEEARNDRLVHDSEALKHKQKQEKEDADRVTRIVKAMPDAFVFQYDGTLPGRQGVGKAGDELVRLKFHPKPDYEPPSRTEQVLTGMQGVMLIDANKHRIAQIDGTLFKDVGFGWGILGHLDKGGHFLVEQGNIGNSDWSMTHMSLSFTGKILLFKSLNIKSDEVYSNFRPAPSNLTFAQGVELLRQQEPVLAEKR